ncbi:kinase-like domain-containing protein [Suillus plorans]|uniref:non-specific serine/threonine protein kinase n=1 Tax=Suillus plorans TaxID=116603 RepID=A0A9P7DIJ9_9AGAM|nr:kinase-like domain-containing protein [Suillus plorans]KAG1795066.1 kinase-like domain-containing protein [Suillus plorans]
MSTAQSSASQPYFTAVSNASAIQSIVVDAGIANPRSEPPDLQYPFASEPADPPADPPAPAYALTHSGPAEVVQTTPVSCTYGAFRVWRTLGEGTYGVAMGAQDVASNRLLCLKVFPKHHLERKARKCVLLNELEAYKRLSRALPCPAARFLMGLEMSFQTRDKICFAMDLMASDLYSYLQRQPTYCIRNSGRWVAQMTLGINTLHEMGIIHRDIKAGNILIDSRENVRITDFGVSYVDKNEGPLDRQRNYCSQEAGTTHTMAPEVLHNGSDSRPLKYGAPADWWSLGCVIYELISKKHKARFESSFAAILLISSRQSLFVTKDDIRSYVSWCSSRDRPSKQFPAFEELHEALADLISGLLQPNPSSRFGFVEVVNHKSFLCKAGTSEFLDVYSRALERKEVPSSLPDLRCGRETNAAEIWFRQPSWEKPRVPNVDWVKPALLSPFL